MQEVKFFTYVAGAQKLGGMSSDTAWVPIIRVAQILPTFSLGALHAVHSKGLKQPINIAVVGNLL